MYCCILGASLSIPQPKARRNLIFQRIPLNNGEPPKKSDVEVNIKRVQCVCVLIYQCFGEKQSSRYENESLKLQVWNSRFTL